MRPVVAFVVLLPLVTPQPAASQAGGGGAAPKPGGACSMLTRDLVMKVSGAVNKHVFDLPPAEEPAGKGTACFYADITLQIDAIPAGNLEAMRKGMEKEWVPVPGVGDAAYFRNNKNHFAELMGRVGARTFTIQIGVPFQGTAEQMKPNVITLANAIVPKLR